MKKIAAVCLLSLLSLNVFAKEQTVTLEVPTMNCVTCPFTVKKALQGVEGVSKAEVTFETKLTVVTFDDEIPLLRHSPRQPRMPVIRQRLKSR